MTWYEYHGPWVFVPEYGSMDMLFKSALEEQEYELFISLEKMLTTTTTSCISGSRYHKLIDLFTIQKVTPHALPHEVALDGVLMGLIMVNSSSMYTCNHVNGNHLVETEQEDIGLVPRRVIFCACFGQDDQKCQGQWTCCFIWSCIIYNLPGSTSAMCIGGEVLISIVWIGWMCGRRVSVMEYM